MSAADRWLWRAGVLGLILVGVIVTQEIARPTCARVSAGVQAGVWLQVWRAQEHGGVSAPPLPDWAVNVRIVPCRDGVVRIWEGMPAPETTSGRDLVYR